MSSAPLDTDAPRIGIHFFLAPQHVLAGCLLASVAVHVLVFVWVPDWTRLPVLPPAPVLEVVMVPGQHEAVPGPQARAAMAQPVAEPPPRRAARPATLSREPRPAERMPVARIEPAARSAGVTGIADPAQLASAPVTAAPMSAPARMEAASTPPAINAAYLRNPPPRYPPAARRNGDEGRVLLRVLVNPEGAAARVELDQSSGSPLLDGAALDAVRGWRFVPARRGAQNVEGWVRVPLVFRLES
jgi:protein TonB